MYLGPKVLMRLVPQGLCCLSLSLSPSRQRAQGWQLRALISLIPNSAASMEGALGMNVSKLRQTVWQLLSPQKAVLSFFLLFVPMFSNIDFCGIESEIKP